MSELDASLVMSENESSLQKSFIGAPGTENTSSLFESLYLREEQIKNSFFRTIEANDKFVVAVAHDGKGHNSLYIYDTALELLATKRLKIKKDDFSFNLCAYIHKIQLVMTKTKKLYIFGVSQKYEYKIFVLEYDNDLKVIKKYKNIHKSLVTDIKINDSQ